MLVGPGVVVVAGRVVGVGVGAFGCPCGDVRIRVWRRRGLESSVVSVVSSPLCVVFVVVRRA